MGLVFSLRGNSLNARYAPNGAVPGQYSDTNNDPVGVIVSPSVIPGVFGGSLLDFGASFVGARGLVYQGRGNLPSTLDQAILVRIVPSWTGSPAQATAILGTGFKFGTNGGSNIVIYNDGTLEWKLYVNQGSTALSITVSAVNISFIANTPTDLFFTWDGTTNANSVNIYQDGALVATGAAGFNTFTPSIDTYNTLCAGIAASAFLPLYGLNELCLFEGIPAISFPRVAFYPAAAFDGTASSDPGIANVKNGVAYEIDGVSLVGTNLNTDPGVANVVAGVPYEINSTPLTGTFVSPASTDPGVANVKSGVAYEIDDAILVGTLVSTNPGIANVRKNIAYTIENAAFTGTLDNDDPGVANVLKGVQYVINSVILTGTLEPAFNELAQAVLAAQGAEASERNAIKLSQGDVLTLQFRLNNGADNLPFDLSGASFQTLVNGPLGVLVTLPNSQHTMVDAANGLVNLTLSAGNPAATPPVPADSAQFAQGESQSIVMVVTQGSLVTYFRGPDIMTVYPPVPNPN